MAGKGKVFMRCNEKIWLLHSDPLFATLPQSKKNNFIFFFYHFPVYSRFRLPLLINERKNATCISMGQMKRKLTFFRIRPSPLPLFGQRVFFASIELFRAQKSSTLSVYRNYIIFEIVFQGALPMDAIHSM